MHRLFSITSLAFFLGGCGTEVAGTAAVSGTTKAQEAKQAQQNVERVRQKLDAANQTGQERQAEAEKTMGY